MTQSSLEKSRSDRRVLKPIFRLAERAMTFPAMITDVHALASDLVRVTLEAEQFRDGLWQPGDKIDVEIAQLSYRAYTPSAVDARLGRLEIMVFDHGQGAGSRRLCTSKAGETLRVRGPKSSTRLSAEPGTLAFFGDETSFGLLVARKSQDPDFRGAGSFIEASSPSRLAPTLAALDLERTHILQRTNSAAPLAGVTRQLSTFLEKAPERQAILTGRAHAIQTIRKQLLAQGICKSTLISHAFWAEGKTALG